VTDLTLIIPHEGSGCQVLLACGHWSDVMHKSSSTFDFPTDPVHCGNCADERYLDLRLIKALLEARDYREEHDDGR
jgi:hypothetical protein